MTNVVLVSESTVEGRPVVRYEHDSLSQWNYAQPQCDYFCLVPPTNPPAGKVPLRVILHSAGGGGESEMLTILKREESRKIQAYCEESSYGLYLDCQKNAPTDWWWGQQTIKAAPDLYKHDLTPTEKRLIAEVEWVIHNFPIDSNRVYLSGISMGGSGSLGLGMCRGDLFAAISVDVPAGSDHALHRLANSQHADPPPVFNFSAQNDAWSKGQEQLLDYCRSNRFALTFTWGPFGHINDASVFNAAVYEFPWLTIRKDEAYPVFTDATTDNHYPGFGNLTAPDQAGQINGYFRWKNMTDTPTQFAMELRLVKKTELHKAIEVPAASTTDITLRRLQRFEVKPGASYKWQMIVGGKDKIQQFGEVKADAAGLLTIPKVRIEDTPGQLQIEFK